MTLTIRRYHRSKDNFYQPDYSREPDVKQIIGANAEECMRRVEAYKMENNVSVYTPYEISKVED